MAFETRTRRAILRDSPSSHGRFCYSDQPPLFSNSSPSLSLSHTHTHTSFSSFHCPAAPLFALPSPRWCELKGANSRSFEIQDRKLDGRLPPVEIPAKRERYEGGMPSNHPRPPPPPPPPSPRRHQCRYHANSLALLCFDVTADQPTTSAHPYSLVIFNPPRTRAILFNRLGG